MGFKMDDTSAEYYRAPVISTAPHTETHWYLQGRIPLYCYFNDFTGQVDYFSDRSKGASFQM